MANKGILRSRVPVELLEGIIVQKPPNCSDLRRYATILTNRPPSPDDAGLVMEIADTSLERDSILKKRIYATP